MDAVWVCKSSLFFTHPTPLTSSSRTFVFFYNLFLPLCHRGSSFFLLVKSQETCLGDTISPTNIIHHFTLLPSPLILLSLPSPSILFYNCHFPRGKCMSLPSGCNGWPSPVVNQPLTHFHLHTCTYLKLYLAAGQSC